MELNLAFHKAAMPNTQSSQYNITAGKSMASRFTHCSMIKQILLFCFNSYRFSLVTTWKAESTKPLLTDAARLLSGFSSSRQTNSVKTVMGEILQYVNKHTFNRHQGPLHKRSRSASNS